MFGIMACYTGEISKIPVGLEEDRPTNASGFVGTSGRVADFGLSVKTVWKECSGGEKTNEKVLSTYRIKN